MSDVVKWGASRPMTEEQYAETLLWQDIGQRWQRRMVPMLRRTLKRMDHSEHQPRALGIDGHAYHRRPSARRRRRG